MKKELGLSAVSQEITTVGAGMSLGQPPRGD